jgi:hypothetical protein
LQLSCPSIIKIDVEGFETHVINGAINILKSSLLLAVILELNGSSQRYELDEEILHQKMLNYGFKPYQYIPHQREFFQLASKNINSNNTLYIRDIEKVKFRINSASQYYICAVNKLV